MDFREHRRARREAFPSLGIRLTSIVDDGGREALENKGKSLLPGGIVGIEGSFKAGDCINCSDLKGNVFARGLTKYSSSDLEQIKGLKTSQIASVLGHKDYDEVIHRERW